MDADPVKVHKRKRTTLACSRCRTRKLRCNGQKPSCAACVESSSQCHYHNPRQHQIRFKLQSFKPGRDLGQEPPPVQRPTSNARGTPPSHNASSSIRIPFFRWFGPTGIAPGYKKMLFDVKQPTDPSQNTRHAITVPRLEGIVEGGFQHSKGNPFFEEDGLTPASQVLYSLLDTFFEHFNCHFPFYRREPFINSVRCGQVSALVLNSICGLAARFSTLQALQNYPHYLRGDPFTQKAKVLLVPLLNLPSYDVVASMLMLVWLELANNHDVGVWMYMGMACRMAMDLGMHKASISGPDKLDAEEYWTVSRVWFSVYHLDHIISFATGRPLSIERKYIDVPRLGIDNNMELPSPFPSMVVIMQTLGLLHDELNAAEQFVTLEIETREKLLWYNDELIRYYANLPRALHFDIHNFQMYVSKGESGTFLMLHLWFHAIMILLHRPGLRYGQEAYAKSIFLTPESRSIALSSARTVSSILSLVEVVDLRTLLSSPFIDQAVEVAGLGFIAELSSSSHSLKKTAHRSNYDICLRTLQRLINYWKGVSWVTTTMEQQAGGLKETDPAEGSVDPHSLIELQDTKMVQKLLEKVQGSMPRQMPGNPQKSIGIGFSGLTNDIGQGNVMILQSNSPINYDHESSGNTDRDFAAGTQPVSASTQPFVSESAFVDGEAWESWIDQSIWEDLDLAFDTTSTGIATDS